MWTNEYHSGPAELPQGAEEKELEQTREGKNKKISRLYWPALSGDQRRGGRKLACPLGKNIYCLPPKVGICKGAECMKKGTKKRPSYSSPFTVFRSSDSGGQSEAGKGNLSYDGAHHQNYISLAGIGRGQ